MIDLAAQDTITLVAGGAGVLIGLIFGLLLGQLFSPRAKDKQEMRSQLFNAQQQLRDYQEEVSEHFEKTSELFNKMSHSYRDIHEHMASGAMRLGSTDSSRRMVDAGFGKLEESPNSTISSEDAIPPKDYAPKRPGGVLSETYGLDTPANQGSTFNKGVEGKSTDDPTTKID